MGYAWIFGFLLYLCTNIQTKVKQKLKTYNNMTREEITKKLDDLSRELFSLGRDCNEHFAEPVLWITGEFLRNTSYTMDTLHSRLEEA